MISDNNENSEENSEVSYNNLKLNDLTLSLLTNRNKFKKYKLLNNSEYDEYMKLKEKIYKYRNKILEITKEKISNIDKHFSIDVDESFIQYVKSCIHHIELLEFEDKFKDKDPEVLFENIDEINNSEDSENNTEELDIDVNDNDNDNDKANILKPSENKSQSFWGKSIEKNTKKRETFISCVPGIDMLSYVKKKKFIS